MKELDAQKLVIDAVRGGGGFAFKLSNRFLVGIPDLFIQSPEYGTSLWEVKISDWPKNSEICRVFITAKQDQKLREYTEAGGFCGVISFLRHSDLMISIMPYVTYRYADRNVFRGAIALTAYTALKRGHREDTIRNLLVKAHYARDKSIATTHQPQGGAGREED